MRKRFNIRVYGILEDRDRGVLVSDEFVFGRSITKFPGGGLEYGEGPVDCLKREAKEELQVPIEVKEHFYTTDFFQPSAFREDEQVISIYYRISNSEPIPSKLIHSSRDALLKEEGAEAFRWLSLEYVEPEEMDLPIDKKVMRLLREEWFKA